MKTAWDITGNSLGEAWTKFKPLTKIWLPSLLIFTIFQYLVLSPFYIKLFNDIGNTGYGNLGVGYIFVVLILTIMSYFVFAALYVNSWRYLLNDSFKPSWVPFRFDWKASLAVFGYMLLLALIFFVFVLIAIIVFVVSGFSMSKIFMQLEYAGITTMGARFLAALGYFGILLGIAVIIYGTIYMMRGSMILVLRSLSEGQKFSQVLKETKPQTKLFASITLILFAVTLPLIMLIYFIVIFGFLTPMAFLFFLPMTWNLIISAILMYIMVLIAGLYFYYWTATLYAELYRKLYAK